MLRIRVHLLPRVARRRRPPALPDALRERLLAIPAAVPARSAILPQPARGKACLGWLVASPITPLAASFALALALSLLWGNPYRIGAATLLRVQSEMGPATRKVRLEAAALATAAAELSETAVEVLPGASLRASHTLTASLTDWMVDDDPALRERPAGRGE